MILEIRRHEKQIKRLLENLKKSTRTDEEYYNRITYQINNHLEQIYTIASKDLSGQYKDSLRKRINESQAYYRELIYKIRQRKIVDEQLPDSVIAEENTKLTDQEIKEKQDKILLVGLRNFAVVSYVKMLLNTDEQHTKTQNDLDRIAAAGGDLVVYKVDWTNCCDECTGYNDQVYSITGNGYDYPPDIPIHPNCKCYYIPYREDD